MSTYNPNSLDATSKSIIIQVAAKLAVDASTTDGRFDIVEFDTLVDAFTEKMLALNEKYGVSTLPQVVSAPSAPSGGNQAQRPSASGLKVLGTQYGELPSWFVSQAAAAGITQVFDNRNKVDEAIAAGKDKLPPSFRSPKDAEKRGEKNDHPFWPPKGTHGGTD